MNKTMGRYQKVVLNELELPLIGDARPLIRPTIEHKFRALEIIKAQQESKALDLSKVKDHLHMVLASASPDEDRDSIMSYVVNNIFELWFEYCVAIDIFTKEKAEELKRKAEADIKK